MTGRTALRRLLAAFLPAPALAGALMVGAFAPLDWGWLTPFAFALLFASIRVRGGAKAGRQGLVFGLVWLVPTLSWIGSVFTPGWLFTAFWCACYEALFACALGRYLSRTAGRRRAAWVVLAPLVHVFADLLRTVVLTGFPWAIPGYTGWSVSVLLGSADLFGVHGLTIAWLALAAALAEGLVRRLDEEPGGWRPLAGAAVLWGLLAAWAQGKPAVPERPGPTLALLQGNVPQFVKEERVARGLTPDRREALDRFVREWLGAYVGLAREAASHAAEEGLTIDAVVWPETMVPVTLTRESATALDTSERNRWWAERLALISRGAHTIAGVQTARLDPEGGGRPRDEWNTVLLIDPEARPLGFQDKQHLCPGGEYVPYLDLIPFRESFVAWLEEEAGYLPALRPGTGPHLLPLAGAAGETRIGVLVCYESIFPELSHAMLDAGADVILNASNYGWFAETAQMEQALAMAAVRAAELRRAFVLSSNNGITAVIGPDGSVRDVLEAPDGQRQDVAGFLVATVPIGSGSGPYGWWGETGAWVLGALGVVASLLLARAAPRTFSEQSVARPGQLRKVLPDEGFPRGGCRAKTERRRAGKST